MKKKRAVEEKREREGERDGRGEREIERRAKRF